MWRITCSLLVFCKLYQIEPVCMEAAGSLHCFMRHLRLGVKWQHLFLIVLLTPVINLWAITKVEFIATWATLSFYKGPLLNSREDVFIFSHYMMCVNTRVISSGALTLEYLRLGGRWNRKETFYLKFLRPFLSWLMTLSKHGAGESKALLPFSTFFI